MATITTRSGKGSPLTNNEVDANFTNLNTDKAELSGATFTGAITANAGVVVDNFTLDGTTLSLSSGNMTLDVAGNIILDSNAGQVVLADGGSNKGLLKLNGNNLEIKTEISNADMKFNGNDGGSAITALTLDMSNAGKATFNSGADFGADTQVTGIMSLYSTHLGAVIGSIGNTANDLNIYSTTSGHNGLRFHVNGILPTDNAGTIIDNDADLGDTSYRFKDLHLSGSIKNTSDITLDAAGDIILDADGADVILKDGGTGFLEIDKDGDNARLKNPIADGDIKIQGIDGASTITALTLDMSNAGAATFNAGATIQTASNEEDALLIKQSDGTDVGSLRINNGSFLLKGKSASQPVQIQSHDGNEDIEIDPDGFIKFETAGSERLRIDSSGNVGIGGTPDSDVALHIKGDGKRLNIDSDDYNLVSLGRSGSSGAGLDQGYFRLKNAGVNTVQIHTNGDSYFNGGDVGIGTSSPSSQLHISSTGSTTATIEAVGGGDAVLDIKAAEASGGESIIRFSDSVSGVGFITYAQNDGGSDYMRFGTAGSERMRIFSDGDVSIGMTDNHAKLNVNGHVRAENSAFLAGRENAANPSFAFHDDADTGMFNIASNILAFATGGTERMRIDSSGNLLVGKTANDNSTVGGSIRAGESSFVSGSSRALTVVRTTGDGDLVEFRKAGTTVGSIGTEGGRLQIGKGASGLYFYDSGPSVLPWNIGSNAGADNSIDLGSSGTRFDDIYATNGTIQTSDAREKTEVREFTDAEMRVAKKLSKNIGFFQWLASVEEKGDDARMHCGQTVQSVIAEFESEGLDAFDYAMICYNEWDAETVEHPAVEAVEAVDAVYDEEGELISEAIEAVEAADAWTETTQEAGDRYSLRTDQLNHFMVKGLAQAQEELEARISALEA